jgi:endoglucanase
MPANVKRLIFVALALIIGISACTAQTPTPAPLPSTPTHKVSETPISTVQATATKLPTLAPTLTSIASPQIPDSSQDKLPMGGGVSLSSTEWYQPGWKLEPPLSVISMVKDWGAVYVRIPVSQRTWLRDKEYRLYIDSYVQEILSQGMYAVIDLHWSDQANPRLTDEQAKQQKMPDRNSVEFWKGVAQEYKNEERIIFEIYNEPHSVSTDIWRHGGKVDEFEAVGMQTLVDTIREITEVNWIIVNGLDYGYTWEGLEIAGKRIYRGTHIYALKEYHHKDDPAEWDKALGSLTQQNQPVFISEFGDLENCDGAFYQKVIDYALTNSIPWIAWAVYPADDACAYPALISDWSGSTTPAGDIVIKNLGTK